MASFTRRRSPAAAWSVDDASTFAAQKEFKLLQLLSTDKKAFTTARRLGLFFLNSADRKVWCCCEGGLGAPHARRSVGAYCGAQQPPAAQRLT